MNSKPKILVLSLVFLTFCTQASDTVVWGGGKFGLKVGLDQPKQRTSNIVFVLYLSKEQSATNKFILPPPKERFLLKLKDSDGRVVEPRTQFGARQISTKMSRSQRIRRQLSFARDDEPAQVGFFEISDYFDLKGGGTYELEVTVFLLRELDKDLIVEPLLPVKTKFTRER
jgi:hypothetical protein